MCFLQHFFSYLEAPWTEVGSCNQDSLWPRIDPGSSMSPSLRRMPWPLSHTSCTIQSLHLRLVSSLSSSFSSWHLGRRSPHPQTTPPLTSAFRLHCLAYHSLFLCHWSGKNQSFQYQLATYYYYIYWLPISNTNANEDTMKK